MTCQNCSDPTGHDRGAYCPDCVATKYPPVSALSVVERLKNAERVYRDPLTEARLVVLGSTLGMLFAIVIMAFFIVWVTL